MTWRLAGALEVLVDEVLDQHPGTTVWSIGDADHAARASDHNPSPDGVVCAVDLVGVDVAGDVWNRLRARRDRRLKYMIHRSRIVSSSVSPWQVRRFDGHPHDGHIHVSVGRGPDGSGGRPDLYDDRSPWGLFTPRRYSVMDALVYTRLRTPDADAVDTLLRNLPAPGVVTTHDAVLAREAVEAGVLVYEVGGHGSGVPRDVTGSTWLRGDTFADTLERLLEQHRAGWLD